MCRDRGYMRNLRTFPLDFAVNLKLLYKINFLKNTCKTFKRENVNIIGLIKQILPVFNF